MKSSVACFVLAGVLAGGSIGWSAPLLDGSIGSEGWIHLTENPYAGPYLGGQQYRSDDFNAGDGTVESSGYHRWDGAADVALGDAANPRGNVHNLFVQWDTSYLYVAAQGPTVPFATWNGPNAGSGNDDGDQGDLYIAIDAGGGNPSGFLTANDAHRSFHNANNPQAVDFEGWQPTHFIGAEWVRNSDFASGQGYANIEAAGTHAVSAGEGHYANNGGFEWAAGLQTVDGFNMGVYEFAIPWSDLGFAGIPNRNFRLAMYTTYNDDYHDVYDSGPGVGQGEGGIHEEIGDFPGDYDDGAGDDGLDAGTAGQYGVPFGSFPGSNYVDPNSNNYGAAPNRGDQIDTISEYLTIAVVPEPGTLALVFLGLTGALTLRRLRRG
jgi:hypothetical protein